MDDQDTLVNLDNLLLQLALHTRELSQKKDETKKQIQYCKDNVAERKSYIEETKTNIKKLEEESYRKQNIVKHFKASAKSMKGTNSRLHQYEKTLQVELERRLENCNQDMKVYNERIESYRKVFQQHKEHYCQHPLAKNLLVLQSEKEEIECRIQACEEQILAKQKDLQHLQGQTSNSSPIKNQSESITGHLNAAEHESQSEHQPEDDIHSHVDVSSLHLTQPKDGHQRVVGGMMDEGQENNLGRDAPAYALSQGDKSFELWSNPESMDQMPSTDQDQAYGAEEQEEQLNIRKVTEAEVEEKAPVQAPEQAPLPAGEEENEGVPAYPQSSPVRTYPQSSPARMKAYTRTPTFSLNSSPGSSPGRQDGPEAKSPGFLFAMSTTPTTPGFSGFDMGFDMGSAQEEESPFSFTSSYFSEKKPSGSKSSSGFLFDQGERSEDGFEFSFGAKSPEQTSVSGEKEGARDSFPFSFNFGKF